MGAEKLKMSPILNIEINLLWTLNCEDLIDAFAGKKK